MRKRSGFAVMCGLIGMIKPLLGHMLLAVMMGCAGNLAAAFITILGGYGLLTGSGIATEAFLSDSDRTLHLIIGLLIALAVLRGILRYTEQACNHYIAFKLLARIRHKVFAALRRLAPAKLDEKDRGNLISMITSDIELLEVFYAHTISPIAIAVITSVIMSIFIGSLLPVLGVAALCFYVIVGAVIPYLNGRAGSADGREYREKFGELNTAVLDNLYGLDEILQYEKGTERLTKTAGQTEQLERISGRLKWNEARQRTVTDSIILLAGVAGIVICGYYEINGELDFGSGVIAVIALMSSFGPTGALAALSNNLNRTLASGDRILNLLNEEPLVQEVKNGEKFSAGDIAAQDLSFAYPGKRQDMVVRDYQGRFCEHKIYGIHGQSGCGKSTLLKLLMRFYEPDQGSITYGDRNVNHITTKELRNQIAYVTQETFLFHDTIANNIRMAKSDASDEEVTVAAQKASVHDFIMTLPDGYQTMLTELGSSVSGGEKQRIGIARAFLHSSSVLYLDEPTSNIDSLNEGIILKSLNREKAGRTILLVSHRKSTLGIADEMITM